MAKDHHTFGALKGMEDRLTPDELEACAGALFLSHGDLEHYEEIRRDLVAG